MSYERKISSSMLERKRQPFGMCLKSLSEDGKFAGYASVFDIVDSQRDIMLRGAFNETLKGRIDQVKLLWQHQNDEVIGVFEKIFEDSRGLYVEGRLLLDVQRAREAYTLLKAGALSGLSIGYSPLRYKIDDETGVRYLSQVELWEVSLVTFPANQHANVTVVKQKAVEQGIERVEPSQLVMLSDTIDKAINSLF